MIKVIVSGMHGKMGREVINMVQDSDDLELVCGISPLENKSDVLCFPSLQEALHQHTADVLIDFTTPYVVKEHMRLAIEKGVRPVVGTTGLTSQDIQDMSQLCQNLNIGAIIAPNFAIGVILMMSFASQAAKYLPNVEIIELHHNQKLDAPSGTSIKTAEMISAVRAASSPNNPAEKEVIPGARGASYQDINIHSVRLPGLVAHQEVLLGDGSQLLSIKHDSFNRESFMPGVRLATKKVMELDHLVYGLENILSL